MTQEVQEWSDELAAALGLDPEVIDVDEILGMTGVVAHAVVRPAAPMSAFLVGLAAGLQGGERGAIERAVAIAKDLAQAQPDGLGR